MINEISEKTSKLISQYNLAKQQALPRQDATTIHVDEVAKKVAEFYEHIRTIVDWKEEHLMRRAAIIRKLKRKFFDLELNNFTETQDAAESLVLELIRGGHFPNDRIEESKINDVQKIIDKYIFILQNNPENKEGKAGVQFYNWLIEVSACEIEETLSPSTKELALIDYMFESMREKIKVSEKVFELGLLNKHDADAQIYIATCVTLFKLDKPMIVYNLLRYKFPGWQKADDELISKIAQSAFKIWKETERNLISPMANKFYAVCEKYDTPYLIMGDILSSLEESYDAQSIKKEVLEPSVLESLIKSSYSKRLATLKSRISRAAIYSTISIFVTKVLSLVLLEVLIEKAMGDKINTMVLVGDVLIPTLLMFLIVSSIKKPSSKNLNIVTMEVMKIAYKKEVSDTYEIKVSRKKGFTMKIILSLVYVLSAFITFGAIFWVLSRFNFPITSILIDIIFIALILFAGTALAKRAQELTMEEEKESFLSFISDIFFLPIQGLGRWLSNKWKRYNFITSFFNALIDMPFSAFVEFIEKWRYFIKERKEDIR